MQSVLEVDPYSRIDFFKNKVTKWSFDWHSLYVYFTQTAEIDYILVKFQLYIILGIDSLG